MNKQSWLVGTAVAVVTTVVGVTMVFVIAGSGDQAEGAATASSASSTSTSSAARRSTTTTTKAGSTTTTAPAAASSTLPATGPAATATRPPVDEAAEPPEPPDPPDPADRYQEVPFPSGATGTIASCGWSPSNGGELVATGTVTNREVEDAFWSVNVSWLVPNQGQLEELDYQFATYDLAPGQTLPWTQSTPSRIAPATVSCAISID